MGRVVCIANQKGGVGKTTTSINLSASLAISGRRTLLIDLDPQANATSGLGVRDLDDRLSTYDLLMGESSARDIVTPTAQEGLEILPAQRDLVGAEVELVQALAREHRLAEALQPIREEYDIIVIDCPPSLGLLTINGLTASNGVLIPLQCEYYALEGLSALLDTIGLIRERLNPELEIEGILLTMFDTRNSLSHQVAEEVRQHFGDDVFETMIPRNVRLSESPSHGVPVAHYDATSKGAQAYLDLAEEMMPRDPGESSDLSAAEPNAEAIDSSDPPVDSQTLQSGDETPAGEEQRESDPSPREDAAHTHDASPPQDAVDPASPIVDSDPPIESPQSIDSSSLVDNDSGSQAVVESGSEPEMPRFAPPAVIRSSPDTEPTRAPNEGAPQPDNQPLPESRSEHGSDPEPIENIQKEVEQNGSPTQSFGEGAGRPDHPGAGDTPAIRVTESDESSARDDIAQQVSAKRDI